MSGKRSSSLLIDEQPLQVIPSLAEALGVNAAVLLQQINYWIKHAERGGDERKLRRGKWWTYNSYSDWQKQMPWLSESGIRKLVKKLRDLNLIAVVKHKSQDQDHTLWYTINYEAVENLRTSGQVEVPQSDTSKGPAGAPEVPQSDTSYMEAESPESLSKTPPKPPQGGSRGSRTIKAPTSSEYAEMVADFVADDPLGPMLHRLIRLSAGENKTGRKRYSTAWTGFVEPLRGMRESGIAETALLSGLQAALQANAPSMKYVEKVALKYEPSASPVKAVPDTEGNTYTDPDTGKVKQRKDFSHLFGETA